MKIFVAHASAFPFEEKLYAPIRASALFTEHEFVLPEEQTYNGTWNTKEEIEISDLMIADVSAPSTGAGIEMGWANAAGISIIAAYEQGSTPSSVVRYLTGTMITYENGQDLIQKLEQSIKALQN